jgi:CRP-like cAMP-binding protein
MAPRHDLSVLDVLPEFGEVVDATALDVLRRALGRRTIALQAGRWNPLDVPRGRGAFAIIVLDGLVLRESTLSERRCTELHAPGDVASPWIQAGGLVPVEVTWRVLTPATVVILDQVFMTATGHWPALTGVLAERYGETCARLATHKAICQLPRVEERITFLLWHVAERLGHVGTGVVTVPLAVTHEELGHLIGARRSTVTLALRDLGEAGVVGRREDGAFVLRGTRPPFALGASSPGRRAEQRNGGARGTGGGRRSAANVDLDTLRERLGKLSVAHRAVSDRTARQLDRARSARAHSVAVRASVRADHEKSRAS